MVLVCAPEDELATASSISLKALHGRSMVCFESGLVIRHKIDRAMHSAHVETKIAMEFDNIETIKRAVEIGAGVSLLPEPTVTREVEAGTLVKVPLEDDTLVRPLGIVHRRGKKLTITAERFRNALTASSATNSATNGEVLATPDVVDRPFAARSDPSPLGAPVAVSSGRLPR